MNDVADVKQANAGDTIKRRGERGIAELGLSVFDRSLVAFDLRIELVDGSLLVIELLSRDGIAFRKLSVPLQVQLRILNAPDRAPAQPAPAQAGPDTRADRFVRAARLSLLTDPPGS